MLRISNVGMFAALLAGRVAFAAEVGTAAPSRGELLPDGLSLGGSYFVGVSSVSSMRVLSNAPVVAQPNGALSATTQHFGEKYQVPNRLRFSPEYAPYAGVRFVGDVQLAAGYLASSGPADRFEGQGRPLGDNAAAFGSGARWVDQLKLRKLYVDWRSPVGVVMAGRMASQWGLGLMANSGDDDLQDWGSAHFGLDRNYGDIVNRVLFATAPIAAVVDAEWAKRWTLALGADVVERDERIDRSAGDLGREGIGVIRYKTDSQEGGVYVAYRDLVDRSEDWLKVWAVDLFAKASARLGDVEIYGAGELVFVTGRTTWGADVGVDKLDVKQLGYLARGGATYVPWKLGGDVELGYASGDANPADRYLRNFTFDPSYNPSLIMFGELRAAETAATAANAGDPARVGYPPHSARLLPTDGAVTNAIYLRPTVRYEWSDLKARVALLWARAEEAVVSPYLLRLTSGRYNYQGGNADARQMGVEIDVAVDYTYRLGDWAELSPGLQAGHLFPGPAFKNAEGRAHPGVSLVFGRLQFSWLPPKS